MVLDTPKKDTLYKIMTLPTSLDSTHYGVSINTKRIDQILKNNEVYLSAPVSLNDEYEFQLNLDLDSFDETRLKKLLQIFQADIDLSEESIKDFLTDFRPCLLKEFNKTYGIFCMTERISSPVMWGHYGSQGYGVALGFHGRMFKDLRKATYPQISYFGEVVYQDQFSKYEDFQIPENKALRKLKDHQKLDCLKQFLANIVFQKYKDWEYEKEWRYVESVVGNSSRLVSIPEGLLEGLYFGPKIPLEVCNMLKAKYTKEACLTNFYRMEYSSHSYELIPASF